MSEFKRIASAIAETVAQAGDRGVPTGHLYAALMGRLTLDQFNRMIAVLQDPDLDLIKVDGSHLARPTPKLLEIVKGAA